MAKERRFIIKIFLFKNSGIFQKKVVKASSQTRSKILLQWLIIFILDSFYFLVQTILIKCLAINNIFNISNRFVLLLIIFYTNFDTYLGICILILFEISRGLPNITSFTEAIKFLYYKAFY